MTSLSSMSNPDTSMFAALGPVAIDPAERARLGADLAPPSRGQEPVDPPSRQSRDLPLTDDDADRIFAGIEALVKAKSPATGPDAVVQSIIKQVIAALDLGGMLDTFEVVAVAKDPTRPFVYFVTKDGSVIATELNRVGLRANPQVLGVSFDFFGRLGPIKLKPTVGLVLPNGDCLLLINR